MTDAVRAQADLALAEQCRANAPGAFEEVYRAHAPRLFGLACRMVGRPDAEDLLQEIFLTAYRKLGQYRGDSALGTWLFRVGTNVCVDHLRSRHARFAHMADPIDDEPIEAGVQAGAVLGVVDRLDLERALVTLPPGAARCLCCTWRPRAQGIEAFLVGFRNVEIAVAQARSLRRAAPTDPGTNVMRTCEDIQAHRLACSLTAACPPRSSDRPVARGCAACRGRLRIWIGCAPRR